MKKKRNKTMTAGMKFLFALLFTASIGLIAAGVYLMFFKNRDAYERQAEERDLADTYIDDLILKLTDPEAYEKKVQEEAKEKAEQISEEAQMKGFEEGRQKGYEEGLIRAEEENEAKHHENQRFFKESLEKALIEINKEKEKCLREYLEELKDIAVAVAEKVIHISLRSSGSVISRMIEAETEKLQKMDWVKIYMEKEDYETMVQADGHLAEKLSRLSDNVKFIVMEDGKCGSCIIEMPDGIIDMSVDTQLENIHRLVDNANT